MSKSIREERRQRDKSRRETTKAILRNYKENLDYIESLKAEISKKRDRIDGVKSGLGNTYPSKGGGSSQEDTIVKVLDDIQRLEEEIYSVKLETLPIRRAIKSIEDPQHKAIIMRVWVDNTDSMRSLATQYGVSHTAIWKKSDVALLSLYKVLIWTSKG